MQLAAMASAARFDELIYRRPIPIFRTTLSCCLRRAANRLSCLMQTDRVTAWHFPDTRFGVPKAHIIAALESGTMNTPARAAAVQLYLAYIEDQLGAQFIPRKKRA